MRWLDRALSWLYTRRFWGPRCRRYDYECPRCIAWRNHDELFGDER